MYRKIMLWVSNVIIMTLGNGYTGPLYIAIDSYLDFTKGPGGA